MSTAIHINDACHASWEGMHCVLPPEVTCLHASHVFLCMHVRRGSACASHRLCAQVFSMYLYHELPPTIRRLATAEMYRVVKPGGTARSPCTTANSHSLLFSLHLSTLFSTYAFATGVLRASMRRTCRLHSCACVSRAAGLCILQDGTQYGDRPFADNTIQPFADLNEPHYIGYAKQDLAELFGSVGFEPQALYMSSFCKTVSFIKPQ